MNFSKLKLLLSTLVLTIFLTACSDELSTIETAQEPDLNAIASQINASPEYKAVKEIRIAIFDELANFYMENKDRIEADPSILDDFLSSTTNYDDALLDATEQLKNQFNILNTLTEEKTATIFEIADKNAVAEMGPRESCWDFCHNQYLSCDSNCYARYIYFSSVTYQDYIDCNHNCVLFVFDTCLDLCH